MKSKEIAPEKKFLFVVLSVFTAVIVLTGWFFSFRDSWRAANLSLDFSKVAEVKDGVSNIASDLKEGVQENTAILEPVIDETVEVLREKQAQEAAAKETIGEIMAEQLTEGVAGENSTEASSIELETTDPIQFQPAQ